MDNLKKADESLSKLTDVRIVYLPPATVASAHYIGEDPEDHVDAIIDQFVRSSGLHKRMPELRHYGFNHPNPVDETGYHGYEMWVTIPPDMELPEGLTKKTFPGGLYAAHMIEFGNFEQWDALIKWGFQNEKYAFAGDFQDQEHMCGLLEEHLNYVSHIEIPDYHNEDLQLDLLMPIKPR